MIDIDGTGLLFGLGCLSMQISRGMRGATPISPRCLKVPKTIAWQNGHSSSRRMAAQYVNSTAGMAQQERTGLPHTCDHPRS